MSEDVAPNAAVEVVTSSPEMGTDISNAIVTRAPLTAVQLECAMEHYSALEAMLRKSGPRFVNARRDAVDMHNKALELYNELEAKNAPNQMKQPSRALS